MLMAQCCVVKEQFALLAPTFLRLHAKLLKQTRHGLIKTKPTNKSKFWKAVMKRRLGFKSSSRCFHARPLWSTNSGLCDLFGCQSSPDWQRRTVRDWKEICGVQEKEPITGFYVWPEDTFNSQPPDKCKLIYLSPLKLNFVLVWLLKNRFSLKKKGQISIMNRRTWAPSAPSGI